MSSMIFTPPSLPVISPTPREILNGLPKLPDSAGDLIVEMFVNLMPYSEEVHLSIDGKNHTFIHIFGKYYNPVVFAEGGGELKPFIDGQKTSECDDETKRKITQLWRKLENKDVEWEDYFTPGFGWTDLFKVAVIAGGLYLVFR